MDGFRELLHQKASTHLPNWPKGPGSFYVAILPHSIHPTKSEGANFLWLKAKGKSTVGKVRGIHCTRLELETGTEVRLADGPAFAKEDALIRDLDYFKSGVVVFWSVARSTGGTVPLEVPFEKVPTTRQSSVESDQGIPRSNEDDRIPSLSPKLPSITRPSFNEELQNLRDRHFNALFEAQEESGTHRIRCSDCPLYSFTNICEFSQHLDSEEHKAAMKRRVRLMLDLYKNLRHRYGFTGLNIPTTGHGFRTPLPKIKCELCLEWEHKILGGDEVPSLLAVGKAHLKSPGHPVEYDEEEVKEYVRQNSRGCLSSTHIKLLERLQKRHPGSELGLDVGGDSATLIHCRDCHVYIHMPSSKEVDSSQTIRKVDEHFATTRHKRLARTRMECNKKRKRLEKISLDDMPVKRQRQETSETDQATPLPNSPMMV